LPQLQADPYVGLTLQGRYRLVQCLGEGAMGVVYLGQDTEEKRAVAVKMLADAAMERYADQTEKLIERFKREIATTRKLSHPNIVSVLADGETTDGFPYVVLEYLEGWDLRDVLDDEEKLHPERAARVGLGIALALSESHSHGIVHRDLKPENIFLVQKTSGEGVKVLDFGIARITEEERERLTVAGTALGTPRYMAPEQVTDAGLTPATDIYSFGILLFEMLSGDIPFYCENELDLALMHVNSVPAKLDVEGMPVELLHKWRGLIDKLLQKKPGKRPTASDVATELALLHTMALKAAEVDPDKDTQILRMDVAQHPKSVAGPNTSRPTRVLGVRTTRSGAVLATPVADAPKKAGADKTRRVPTHILTLAQNVNARQRADTDKVADAQRAPTADGKELGELRRAETEKVVDPRRADTSQVGDPDSPIIEQSGTHIAAISNRVPRSRVQEAMRSGTAVISVPPSQQVKRDQARDRDAPQTRVWVLVGVAAIVAIVTLILII